MAGHVPMIYIVGVNIDKHEGYTLRRDDKVRAIGHGVYVDADAVFDPAELFFEYGVRFAREKFRLSPLAHSCAWVNRPVPEYGEETNARGIPKVASWSVYVGGDFPYKRDMTPDLFELVKPKDGRKIDYKKLGIPELQIIQSMVKPDLEDPDQYELRRFSDKIGEFEMFSATLELAALQMMEASRKFPGKRLADDEMAGFALDMLKAHRGDPYRAMRAVDALAVKIGKEREQARFGKVLMPVLRDVAA